MNGKKQTKNTSNKQKEQVVEVVAQEEVVVAKEEVVKEQVLSKKEEVYNKEYTAQLLVHELKVIEFKNPTTVVVENIGGGDLYVSQEGFYLKRSNQINAGNTKEFKNITVLYVTSDSRPTFKLSYSE